MDCPCKITRARCITLIYIIIRYLVKNLKFNLMGGGGIFLMVPETISLYQHLVKNIVYPLIVLGSTIFLLKCPGLSGKFIF